MKLGSLPSCPQKLVYKMGYNHMQYLIKRNSRYYYYRRVPKAVKDFDPRTFIKLALKTECRKQAYKAAIERNDELEAYWLDLTNSGSLHSIDRFRGAVETARLLGFSYHFAAELSKLSLDEIINRATATKTNIASVKPTEAILGGVQQPQILLSECLPKFWEYSKNKTMNKSPDQFRKWQNPRKKAMKNLIHCVGNKPINELTREDTLKFRDYWISRINTESLHPGTANKDIIQIKTIIESVSDNLNLGLDIKHLFRKLVLENGDDNQRLPFENDYIVNTLLNEEKLSGLKDEAKAALFAFSETGAGFSELTGLLPEDIILDHEIPHIVIMPRSKKGLKTKYRKRIIPLVGYALDAFKAYPNGFTSYYGKPDNLTNTVAKYLRENKLLPSEKHSVYSLRHSFQDRLLALNVPDRLQADLMGHKFSRPYYGDGASLSQKFEYLKRIQLGR